MREGGAKDGPSFGLISVTMLKYHDRKQFGKKGVYFGYHCGEVKNYSNFE